MCHHSAAPERERAGCRALPARSSGFGRGQSKRRKTVSSYSSWPRKMSCFGGSAFRPRREIFCLELCAIRSSAFLPGRPIKQSMASMRRRASTTAQRSHVPVFVTSRRVVDGMIDQMAAMGLRVDRIVARERDAQADTPVTLWSRLANAPQAELALARWRIGAGIAAFVALSLGLSVWAIASASAIREESEDLAARAKAIQRQLQPSHTPQSLAALKPEERAWVSKQTSAPAVIMLEALSRALPVWAYLTELQLEKTTLRITGLTRDAPSLIAPLERSGHLADVHFLAPTTREF